MSTFSFFSDPHVKYLSQILDEVLAGGVLIPRFQRPYVWDWDKRLDLFRSIRIGIPMGAIMVWRTNDARLRTYDDFGRIRFKKPLPDGPRQYLLDGVQRLSTLVSSLAVPALTGTIERAGAGVFDVLGEERLAYFDLMANDFVALKLGQRIESHYMPMSVLLDSIALVRFQRDLLGSKGEQWIPQIDEVAKAFREYKIPVIPILTEDIGLASQTFQRINSAGVQMSEKDMLHALTYSADFDFAEELDRFHDHLESIGWGGLDDDLLLKTVKLALHLDIYRSNVDQISASLKKSPNVLLQLKDATTAAKQFFENKCGIPSTDLIPYGLQTIAVIEAFRLTRFSSGSIPARLADWIWLTTYSEYFTGLSGDRVNAQLEAIARACSDSAVDIFMENPETLVFQSKGKFDFRSARSRASCIVLAEILNRESKGDNGSRLLREYGKSAIVPGIPKEYFAEFPQQYYSPGNRFLIDPNSLKGFREALLNGEIDRGSEQGISETSLELLKRKRYVEFVNQRHLEISAEEAEKVSEIVNRSKVQR